MLLLLCLIQVLVNHLPGVQTTNLSLKLLKTPPINNLLPKTLTPLLLITLLIIVITILTPQCNTIICKIPLKRVEVLVIIYQIYHQTTVEVPLKISKYLSMVTTSWLTKILILTQVVQEEDLQTQG